MAIAGGLSQVATIFFQRAVAALGLAVGDALAAAQLLDGLQNALAGDAELLDDTGRGRVALAQDGQKDVFGGDVFVLQAVGLALR